MIWEQQCLVIVMTTKVMERGRVKCGQYWESEVGGVAKYENYHAKTVHVESNEDYTVVTIELTNIKVRKTSFEFIRIIKLINKFDFID